MIIINYANILICSPIIRCNNHSSHSRVPLILFVPEQISGATASALFPECLLTLQKKSKNKTGGVKKLGEGREKWKRLGSGHYASLCVSTFADGPMRSIGSNAKWRFPFRGRGSVEAKCRNWESFGRKRVECSCLRSKSGGRRKRRTDEREIA